MSSPSSRTCTRMRRAGRPMSRSTPTVSRRSSTSMIVSARRNTVDGQDRDCGDGEVEAFEDHEGAAGSGGAACRARNETRDRRVEPFGECLRVRRVDQRDVDRFDVFGPCGCGLVPRQREEVREVQAHFAGQLRPVASGRASARRCRRRETCVPCRLVRRSPARTVVADRQPLDLRELARNQDGRQRLLLSVEQPQAARSRNAQMATRTTQRSASQTEFISIRFHSASVTGMTESRDILTSAKDANAAIGLDGGKRDRRGELSYRRDIEGVELAGGVRRIRVRVACGLRYRDDRLLLARVVVEDSIALADAAEVLLCEGVSDTGPGRSCRRARAGRTRSVPALPLPAIAPCSDYMAVAPAFTARDVTWHRRNAAEQASPQRGPLHLRSGTAIRMIRFLLLRICLRRPTWEEHLSSALPLSG